MRDTTSSHILETILTRSSQPVLDKLWELYYVGRVAKLAGHPVANFTVARGIERIDAEALRGAVGELATEEEAVRRLLRASAPSAPAVPDC